MTRTPDWLQLYFVLASLLGLVLIVIGAVTLINTSLKATVLKTESFSRPMPPQPYIDLEKVESNTELSAEDKAALAQWHKEFEAYQQEENARDYEAEGRKQAFAFAIAILITGVPIFALHAPRVFR